MHSIFTESFPSFDLENGFILNAIRPESDAKDYFFYMNSLQVRLFVSEGNVPASIEKSKEDLRYWGSLFSSCRGFYWAIRDETTESLVGTIGFNTLSFIHLKGEVSYDLAFEYWNKGIMTKALNEITDFAQNQLKLNRIQACTAKNNKKSIKLLERCKFKPEGLMKKFELLNGVHVDYILYALTK